MNKTTIWCWQILSGPHKLSNHNLSSGSLSTDKGLAGAAWWQLHFFLEDFILVIDTWNKINPFWFRIITSCLSFMPTNSLLWSCFFFSSPKKEVAMYNTRQLLILFLFAVCYLNYTDTCSFNNKVMYLRYYKHRIKILLLRDASSLSQLHTDTCMGIFSNKSIYSFFLLQDLWAMQCLKTYCSKLLMLYEIKNSYSVHRDTILCIHYDSICSKTQQ